MTKWEYLLEKIVATGSARIGIVKPPDQVAMVRACLEKLGEQGWELVAVTPPFPGYSDDVTVLLYFKREK